MDTPGAFPWCRCRKNVVKKDDRAQLARNAASGADRGVHHRRSGSGGALALAVGDPRILMLENAIYSGISPEGCAAILWAIERKVPRAAEALRLTARDLLQLAVVDRIVEEPKGRAHRDLATMGQWLRDALVAELDHLATLSPEVLLENRTQKFLRMGRVRGCGGRSVIVPAP